MNDAAEAIRIGLAEYVVARESFDQDVVAPVGRVIANSALSHRIAAFSGKRG